MGLPGTPHTAKIALGWTYGATGIVCENVFYVRDDGDSMFSDPATYCNNVFTAATTALKPHLFPVVILNEVGFEDVRTPPFGGISVPQTPTAGTRAGGTGQLPSSAALSVKKSTGNLGRSGRGRWYWPVGDIAAMVSGDIVATTFVAEIVAALIAFQQDVEAIIVGSELGIVSYQIGGVARTAGLFQRVVAWQATDTNIDSQRRRLLGRGR